MSGYTDAFNQLTSGNITGAVTAGYVQGAGMHYFFYLFLVLIFALPTYIKTESYEMTGLMIMVLGAMGVFDHLVKVSTEGTAGINFIAFFGMLVAFGFTLVLFGIYGRRE